MTLPGQIVPQDGATRLVRRVEDIERRMKELQALLVNQGNITITPGNSLTVLNGSGNTVATLGDVASVSGVHAEDPATGLVMPLAQLAFGATGTNDGGTPFTQTTINTWQAGPMSLTVAVKTGRLLVLVAAAIIVGGAASASETATMSWNLAGPTTVGPATNRGVGAGVINAASPVVPGFDLGLGGYMHTGLLPGTYTITDQYFTTINSGTYTGRSLIAIPF
jgi:hypothetical protein